MTPSYDLFWYPLLIKCVPIALLFWSICSRTRVGRLWCSVFIPLEVGHGPSRSGWLSGDCRSSFAQQGTWTCSSEMCCCRDDLFVGRMARLWESWTVGGVTLCCPILFGRYFRGTLKYLFQNIYGFWNYVPIFEPLYDTIHRLRRTRPVFLNRWVRVMMRWAVYKSALNCLQLYGMP